MVCWSSGLGFDSRVDSRLWRESFQTLTRSHWKQPFIIPSHRPDMTEILLKRRKIASHLFIHHYLPTLPLTPHPRRPTIWVIVGEGPSALAVGAGGGCLDIFTLIYPFSPLSPSLWERARYRLKYCLKGPLNPLRPTLPSPKHKACNKVLIPTNTRLPKYLYMY